MRQLTPLSPTVEWKEAFNMWSLPLPWAVLYLAYSMSNTPVWDYFYNRQRSVGPKFRDLTLSVKAHRFVPNSGIARIFLWGGGGGGIGVPSFFMGGGNWGSLALSWEGGHKEVWLLSLSILLLIKLFFARGAPGGHWEFVGECAPWPPCS